MNLATLNLPAHCRRAWRLTIVPTSLDATHSYTPLSVSWILFLQKRLMAKEPLAKTVTLPAPSETISAPSLRQVRLTLLPATPTAEQFSSASWLLSTTVLRGSTVKYNPVSMLTSEPGNGNETPGYHTDR